MKKKTAKNKVMKYLVVSTRAILTHSIFLDIHKELLGKTFLRIEVRDEVEDIGQLIKITYLTPHKVKGE